MLRRVIIVLIIIIWPNIIYGQQFYRIKADFSIKAKLADGSSQLSMGTVYYDKNEKKLVYKIKFPEPEIWISQDTILYKISSDKVIDRQSIPAMTEFSVFHLSLNRRLPDYGLRNSYYSISNVEKDDNMVITTWIPDKTLNKTLGEILISNKEKQLFGIIFYGPEGNIKLKQFFEDYNNYDGMNFPGRIVQITYSEGKENYQITTFTKVIINDIKENDIYNYTIPEYQF